MVFETDGPGAYLDWEGELETSCHIASFFFSRSATVRIKLGIKAWSLLSSLVFSLVIVAGCNTEESTPSSPGPVTPPPPPPPVTERPTTAPTPPPPPVTEK